MFLSEFSTNHQTPSSPPFAEKQIKKQKIKQKKTHTYRTTTTTTLSTIDNEYKSIPTNTSTRTRPLLRLRFRVHFPRNTILFSYRNSPNAFTNLQNLRCRQKKSNLSPKNTTQTRAFYSSCSHRRTPTAPQLRNHQSAKCLSHPPTLHLSVETPCSQIIPTIRQNTISPPLCLTNQRHCLSMQILPFPQSLFGFHRRRLNTNIPTTHSDKKNKKKINLTPQSLLHLQKNQTSTPQTPTKVHKHQVQTTVDGHNQVKHKSQSTNITNPNTKIKHPPNKSSFFLKKKKKKKKKSQLFQKKKRNLTWGGGLRWRRVEVVCGGDYDGCEKGWGRWFC